MTILEAMYYSTPVFSPTTKSFAVTVICTATTSTATIAILFIERFFLGPN